MVDLYFFYTLVTSEPVVLMHDIVADVKVVEAIDRCAVVAFLFLFPMTCPENVTLGQCHKLPVSILKTFTQETF